ncbi:MAG: ABC transporter permease subunit [Armatimonadetes bacterium]|nr:ABC transporter permease subunit [Armatimonadota bacterium]MBS1725980.1 carbohydrate ABC transporter permease [Armatimonadota bacterium]
MTTNFGSARSLALTTDGRTSLPKYQRVLVYTVLVLLCIPPLLPLLWMISTSLKDDTQIYTTSGTSTTAFSITSLIPSPVHWSNYPQSLQSMPFFVYLRNTLMLCFLTVIGSVASSAVVAYGFGRIQFKYSGFWFAVMLATMALPGQVTMIPIFSMFRSLGWYGTYLPLVVPAFFGAPFFIFLLTQFYKTLPTEFAESAKVDGANEWTIFVRLILPLSRPALATCALFAFLGAWNDFFGPLLYISDPSKYTLAYGLEQFVSNHYTNWEQLMAASVMFTIPIVVLFFFAQKTFIQGIATTGGK